MAKKKAAREVYQLVCEDCGEPNYVLRLKREHKSLKVRKYCPKTRQHTPHKAKKV